MKSEQE
jgi:predicted HicB family RNase H-like nuclease